MRRTLHIAVAIFPVMVFLRVARHYGLTDQAWMRAFVTGAALSLIIITAFVLKRARFRDLLFASGLLLVSGAIAFLADIKPMLAVYKRFQGSIFMFWYLLVRAVFAFAPGMISAFVQDPYEKAPKLAAVFTSAMFVWSFFFTIPWSRQFCL
ncbi:MAG: hypothetical protein HY746_01930 [Elusimicrobia bacterium]|nr:hypothetical protein [Elusimicrobiota bacterium]